MPTYKYELDKIENESSSENEISDQESYEAKNKMKRILSSYVIMFTGIKNMGKLRDVCYFIEIILFLKSFLLFIFLLLLFYYYFFIIICLLLFVYYYYLFIIIIINICLLDCRGFGRVNRSYRYN